MTTAKRRLSCYVLAFQPTKGGVMAGCGCGKKPAAPAKKSSKPTEKKK
ncbi:MAG: hypothetical protein AB7V19_03495 [Candidatus Bipolaricaulia bacterium]